MQDSIAEYNASIIFDYPYSIFTVDKEGKLDTISRFNLVGRFIEWIKDIKSNGQRSKNANQAIINTLIKIRTTFNPNNKYTYFIKDNDRLISRYSPISLFYERLPVHLYKGRHPINEFAIKIINSNLNKDIKEIAEDIKTTATPFIENLTTKDKEYFGRFDID